MVVEDEEKLRRVVQLHLESQGFEVDGAASAEQGLPLAAAADLVITDLRLAGNGRHSTDQAIARARDAGGGDCDDGTWLSGKRGGSDEVGGGRFSAEAVFAGTFEHRSGKSDGGAGVAR